MIGQPCRRRFENFKINAMIRAKTTASFQRDVKIITIKIRAGDDDLARQSFLAKVVILK
jgi:hypothetical protein